MYDEPMGSEVKTFRDLRREVVETGICGGCGGCVSFCSAAKSDALGMDKHGLPVYVHEESCLSCGICYLICPQTGILDWELHVKFHWRPPIGNHKTVSSARTTDARIREICTAGGIIATILAHLCKSNQIDAAIIPGKTSPFSAEAKLSRTEEEIICDSISRFQSRTFSPVMRERYTTYSPIMPAIRSLKNGNYSRVAVVGTPCQIKSIRKMQILGIIPASVVKFAIGTFCVGSLEFHEAGRKRIEEAYNLSLEEVANLNTRENIILTLKNGDRRIIPYEDMEDLMRAPCKTCPDFANVYADVSVGTLASLPEYSTVVVRSTEGQRAYGEAMRKGMIEERSYTSAEELRNDRASMIAQISVFARKKARKAKENLKRISGLAMIG